MNCGGGGNATVSLTLHDSPPANASFLSFTLPIASMSLTPSSGGADVNLFSTAMSFDGTRLASDTAYVGTFQVAAGTYTTLNIFITSSPSAVWYNGTGGTLQGCANGAICTLAGTAPGKITVDLTKALGGSGLVLTANQTVGYGIEVFLANAITTANGISIDMTQPNVFALTTLPRTGQASGTLDTFDGFTGSVTSVSASSITVQSGTMGTLTAALNSSTVYHAVPNQCAGGAQLSCIATGSVVGIDATLAASGTLTATNVDILSVTGADQVEGIIYPTSKIGVYGLILADKNVVSGNAALTAATIGTGIFLTPSIAASFQVDTGILPIANPSGFASTADILSGQVVRAHITSASASGSNVNATTDYLLLRQSRITGNVNGAVTGNTFLMNNLASYLTPFATGPQVQTYAGTTIFDGVADITGLSSGESVSIRALLLNTTPNFQAAKVRKH